jgi:hypothetical protein
MTKAVVPQSSGHRHSGKGRCAGGWGKRVEVVRTIAPGDHAWSLEILHKKAKRVKFNRTIIVGSKATHHYRNQALYRVSRALGKALNTLGKGFAECRTRQRVHDKKFVGKDLFAECFLSGTLQRLCRVPRQHSAKKSCRDGADNVNGYIAECPTSGHSTKIFFLNSLPSAL